MPPQQPHYGSYPMAPGYGNMEGARAAEGEGRAVAEDRGGRRKIEWSCGVGRRETELRCGERREERWVWCDGREGRGRGDHGRTGRSGGGTAGGGGSPRRREEGGCGGPRRQEIGRGRSNREED
eukprot:3450747-Rhodomonas_salina.1